MQGQFTFIAICLAVCSSLTDAHVLPNPDCPPDFKRVGNKCLWFSRYLELNWFEANVKCRRMNSYLLTVENKAELVLIGEALSFLSHPFVWTSITDLGEEGEFYSISTGRRMVFSAWDHHNNQPDNYEGNEHCVHLAAMRWGKYTMNDNNCLKRYSFVCERFYADKESKLLGLQ